MRAHFSMLDCNSTFFGALECCVSFQNICSYKYIALNREEIGIVFVLGGPVDN